VIYSVKRFTPEEWAPLAQDAHKALFGLERPQELNSHHFILGGFGDGELGGYITCLEMDTKSVYIQYGGIFPNFSKSIHAFPAYLQLIGWLRAKYSRAMTKIENTNFPMLKMALQAGFVVMGTEFFEGKLFLNLTNEFRG
jgi:hypothetical protein